MKAEGKATPWIVIIVIVVTLLSLGLAYFSLEQEAVVAPEPVPVVIVNEPEIVTPEPEVIDPIEEIVEHVEEQDTEIVEELEPKQPSLPTLDESDSWFELRLPEMTWRKELLKLVITDDIIRRFVVFTDNFAQGNLAYQHSPFVQPNTRFSATELPPSQGQVKPTWQWDEGVARRFSLYVDLLRSIDSEALVQWYVEAKPLIDQAYGELGYPDEDFTEVLQLAITRVLDMEIPKAPPKLTRPSVMYQYQDPELEALTDADKLLLRIGKDNLLVIKSVLLEINDKLARRSSDLS